MPTTFSELGLSAEVLESINALGYEEPSPIQALAIPPMMAGRDVVAQAQTGTGKTAAFAIPIIERINTRRAGVQAIVVLPTRELAVQVAEAVHALGHGRGITVLPIYGGQPYDRQLRALKAGVHVVVGTPGRIMDHVRRETLRLDTTSMVVLDEADEMLDMGFLEDIEFILDKVPAERQIGLFSATIPARIEALARRYLREPERIMIAQETRTAPQTQQFWYETPYRSKLDVLARILDFEQPPSAIIFCRTKREVDTLAEALQSRGYSTAAIHGDISQAQRELQLRAFRDNRAEILVATDVAARGLDIPDVSHVINYDIPDDADAYVHRIGRTGRMGAKGEAITLVTPRETRLLHSIEQQTRKKMKQLKLPTQADIAARRREAFVSALRETIESGAGEPFGRLLEGLAQEHEPLAIARAALYLAATGGGSGRGDGSFVGGEGEPAEPEPDSAVEAGMVRLFIDAGRKQGVRPQDLVEAFATQAGVAPSTVGTIDLYDSFAFVDMRTAGAKKVIEQGVVRLHGGEAHVKKAVPRTGAGAGPRRKK
ncbi:MAG: DEAD/DEAH box helicase [Chloroflexi bacterium]|nr:DEAD/DEAH box helicase [Chloroflexota bacterium]